MTNEQILMQEINGIRNELKNVSKLQSDIVKLQEQIRKLENSFSFLYNVKELQVGDGNISFRLDKNGLWLGRKLWLDIITGTPQGTGIGMDGTFYGKDGVTGTVSIPDAGGSFTVKNGLVTSL